MKTFLLFIALCLSQLLLAQSPVIWSQLNDSTKAEMLSRSYISKNIVAFYKDSISVKDSVSLQSLMANLCQCSDRQLPFYFTVFTEKMPAYRTRFDSLTFDVHVINMLTYHTEYVLYCYSAFPNEFASSMKMMRKALADAFKNMQWFYPNKETFKDQLWDKIKDPTQPKKKILSQLFGDIPDSSN